jgi:hypothetical protein
MQFAKDSFYMALRTRLATVNPLRTVTIDGAVRPAVVMTEAEPVTSAPPQTETFYLSFGPAQVVVATRAARRPMLALDCEISYRTAGSATNLSVDRGRTLTQLDLELLQIMSPPLTIKTDFTGPLPITLGTQVLWERPELGKIEVVGPELRRTATTTIYFFPEVDF